MMKGLARLIILGTLCVFSTEASTCFDGYCQNGGTCSNFQGKANCSCSSYFTGDQCQLDVDECQVYNQCKNGGTCSNTFGGYICGCIYGWGGPDCSIDKDECLPSGNIPLCYNGGTCVDKIGKYDCICPPGKMGPVCQHDDECFYKPCFGDATCATNAFGQYRCNCPRGWTDKKCNIDVDECNRAKFSPCDHGGTCINTPGSFTCICAPGYTGQQVCVKLVVNTSSASTPPSLSVLASLPTSTPTRSSPKPSVVASISLTPELPTRATITISKDATRVEGQNVLFNCKVDGYPPPSVTWTKNGGELRAGENPRITDSSTSDNHTLNITHIQRSDAGQYRCFFHNSDGNLTSSPATLTVHFAPAFLDPWQLNINITRRTAEGNAHLAFNCTVEGNPSPLLYWTKNGKKLNVTANPRLSTVSSRGIHSLNVINLNRSDAGFYRCVAVNIVGKAVSHGENLRVNYKPVVDISAYGKRLLKIGSQIQLICQYNASPPVSEVQWEKDGIVIARNATVIGDARTNVSKFTVSESLLSIMLISAQDGGKYTCFAANVLGNSSATTSVRIQVQPNPPKMLKLDSRGSRTLQISWTAGFDGNDAIKYYTVEISEDNKRFSNAVCQGTLFSRACVVSTEKASLKDLSPWTSYYIRVFAENAVGRSNSSLVRSFSTEEEGAFGYSK